MTLMNLLEDFIVPLSPPNLLQFISIQREKITLAVIAQIELVLLVMSIVSITAILTGLLVWKSNAASEAVTGFWSVVFTIPSLAMFIFFIGPFGLGWLPAVIALVLYGQLPVVRNTIVGLRSVEPAVMESAAAMGMKPLTVLRKIQFPLAWPVIMVGIRVSAMLIFGISAIAAYVGGPGLGDYLFSGLANLGSFNSMNQTLVGAFGITLLALIFDGLFVFVRRITTPRGLRV
ncbi:OpuBB ABC-type proline/glycine betaine transport systems, permease component [Candidatus Nanopelagicaceae bacterium]|jgi:osmoprotectant transport system permease protein